MDADGLPLVGPGIDYNKVGAINQKRTIAFINHFITHTSCFLNHFANVCEDKLEHLTGRLQQLEISLSILEAKLSSIPGLESVTASLSSNTVGSDAQQNNNANVQSNNNASSSAPAVEALTTSTTTKQNQEETLPPAEETKKYTPVSQDPRYTKYFKMLQYGVPASVVKGKMNMDGLNGDLIDTPDAPAPDEGVSKDKEDSQSDSDSEASFSD